MTKKVKIGNIVIGGGERIAIQSMTSVKTSDIERTTAQIKELQTAGCDLVRVAVLDEKDAEAIKQIKNEVKIPVIADIHFDYKLALKSIENGADKIRINPGNIGGEDKLKIVCGCLKAHKIPIRVGSNSGSIEKEFYDKYGISEVSLCESALKYINAVEKYGVNDIVVSVKASSVPLTVKAYRYISSKCGYPLHIGVTEAGYSLGEIKNAIGIGALLLDGIGDTIRVSLSDEPVKEVIAAKKILRAIGLDKNFVEVISCPTCGRCGWDSIAAAKEIEKLTAHIKKPLKIAVMGCVVNGVGEGKHADIGAAGSGDYGVIFKKGEIVNKVKLEDLKKTLIEEIKKITNYKLQCTNMEAPRA